MTERLDSGSQRCGKTIELYTCPECRVPLIRVDAQLFYCPKCYKKVKALARDISEGYGYFTNDKARKELEELLRPKVLNCSDRVKR